MQALRVLVVEDEAIIGMLFSELLEEMGHSVVAVAATEDAAVAAALEHKPDLMIVDARLQEGSGIGAVDKVLLNGFIPHIFTSGDTQSVLVLRPGAVVIAKPFRESDLIPAIEKACGLKADPKVVSL